MVGLGRIVETISRERGISYEAACETVEEALALGLEVFFGLEAQVRLRPDRLEGWMFTGYRWVAVRWDRLPAGFIRNARELILSGACLQPEKMRQDYVYWKARRHTAIQGVILRSAPGKVDVDLGGHIGIMEKRHFIPGEPYETGKMLKFYVLKVLRPCRVFLSRNTRSLPEAILKQQVPWGTFHCLRRIAGVKCVLTSNVSIPDDMLRKVASELGETMILQYKGKK